MTLLDCRRGDRVRVTRVDGDTLLRLGVRHGLCPGARLTVLQHLPGGTLVVGLGRQELALGRGNAARVSVAREEG